MLSIFTTALCLPPTRGHAAHATPLFHASREYRDSTHYLASMLTYHAVLVPPQKRFLERLLRSSHQLYAAALGSPANAAFRSAWIESRSLVQDLPWVLEMVPPNVQQRLLPQSQKFLQSFQTLAVQIELREQISRGYEHTGHALPLGHAALPLAHARGGVPMFRSEPCPLQRYPYPQPCPCHRCQTMIWSHDDSRPPIGHRLQPMLSPSEWQLCQSEPQHRSKTPIRRETGRTQETGRVGARLSRIAITR
jgi:hypothetical protein